MPALLLPNPTSPPRFFSTSHSLSRPPPRNEIALYPKHFIGKYHAVLSLPPPSAASHRPSAAGEEEADDFAYETIIGDCLVFEEGIFDDPFLHDEPPKPPQRNQRGRANAGAEIVPENLIPEKWGELQREINVSKKDRRKLRQELEYGRTVEKRRESLRPIRSVNDEEFVRYRDGRLKQLEPVVLDKPVALKVERVDKVEYEVKDSGARVKPRNPRLAVYGGGLEDISEFFSSGSYDPDAAKNAEGRRQLFSKEEKLMLNKRVPSLAIATSGKWLPLHTLAASGEFYLVNALLKHNVDINGADKDGFTAIHKAILGKKQAIFNYLLRESTNPFVRDKEGATLMHYAVRTASSQMIKILLLYNVDINLQDDDGWTPLHLAVQSRRTDVVRLLLIKGADKSSRNKDGLTPLELCLHCGRDTRTYELIKLLKQLPKRLSP